MKVANFMSAKVVTVLPSASLSEMWELFHKKHVHSLPVVDKKNKLLGIVAKEDILDKLFPGVEDMAEIPVTEDNDTEIEERLKQLKKFTASKLMTPHIYFTRPDTNVMRALSRMIVRHVRQLPVLDDDDGLVGMISKGDIFEGMFRRKHKK